MLPNSDKLLYQQETSYGCLEVRQQGNQRWLTINGIEQSRINIDHADALSSIHCRFFLSALLFNNKPKTVLLAGTGGGELARYLYHKDTSIQGEAVEIDSTVASIARDYFDFPGNHWELIVDDIRDFRKNHYDIVFADIAYMNLTPPWLTSTATLLHLKQRLSIKGILAINLLVADDKSFLQSLSSIREVFSRKTLCLSIPDHKNIIVLAFNWQPDLNSVNAIQEQIPVLTDQWGIDFTTILEQIRKDNPVGSGII